MKMGGRTGERIAFEDCVHKGGATGKKGGDSESLENQGQGLQRANQKKFPIIGILLESTCKRGGKITNPVVEGAHPLLSGDVGTRTGGEWGGLTKRKMFLMVEAK